MKSKARMGIAVALTLLGAAALSGCLIIPTFNVTTDGRNVSRDVGNADSRKPVRIGFSRDQVVQVLGPPHFANDDGSMIAYRWQVMESIVIAPLCGMWADAQKSSRYLGLRFDEDGTLIEYRLP